MPMRAPTPVSNCWRAACSAMCRIISRSSASASMSSAATMRKASWRRFRKPPSGSRSTARALISAAEGNGPVHALYVALRKDLGKYQRIIDDIELLDFKRARVPGRHRRRDPRADRIRRREPGETWTTVGVSANLIDASFQALLDAIDYKLLKAGAQSAEARPGPAAANASTGASRDHLAREAGTSSRMALRSDSRADRGFPPDDGVGPARQYSGVPAARDMENCNGGQNHPHRRDPDLSRPRGRSASSPASSNWKARWTSWKFPVSTELRFQFLGRIERSRNAWAALIRSSPRSPTTVGRLKPPSRRGTPGWKAGRPILGMPLYAGGIAGAVVASSGALAATIAATLAGGVAGVGIGAVLVALWRANAPRALRSNSRRAEFILWVCVWNDDLEARALRTLAAAGASEVHAHDIEREWTVSERPLAEAQPDPFLWPFNGRQFPGDGASRNPEALR